MCSYGVLWDLIGSPGVLRGLYGVLWRPMGASKGPYGVLWGLIGSYGVL